MKVLYWFIGILALAGCSLERAEGPGAPVPAPIQQGISGTVEFWEGDFMPTAYPQVPGGTVTSVVREVRIHEAARMYDVTFSSPGGFFSEIRTPLVASVESADDGQFAVNLPAGTYSLFVVEDGRFYANRMSQEFIQPVTVDRGKVALIRLKIDYLATY